MKRAFHHLFYHVSAGYTTVCETLGVIFKRSSVHETHRYPTKSPIMAQDSLNFLYPFPDPTEVNVHSVNSLTISPPYKKLLFYMIVITD